MATINSILYRGTEPGSFVVAGYEINQIGVGSSRQEAIENLEEAIEAAVDHARGDSNTALASQPDSKVIEGFEKVVVEGSYTPEIRRLKELGITLHVYDLTDKTSFSRKKMPMLHPDKFCRVCN